MTFRNELEEQCYEIAKRVFSDGVSVEHNKIIQIESALFPEVAAFSGPPKKEIDVLTTELLDNPKVVLLISCKQLARKVEPAHIQEWAAVVQTMNKYAEDARYFGLIICINGFTSGCESWATAHNIGILPPLKGRPVEYSKGSVLNMFERTLNALKKRAKYPFSDLTSPPGFFDFVFRMVSDYEGRKESAKQGRYYEAPSGWLSSFGELYSKISDHMISDLLCVEGATILKLDNGVRLRFNGNYIEYGNDDNLEEAGEVEPVCRKNIESEECTFDFLKSVAIDKRISSAGDFGTYIEFGLDQRYNLGLHRNGFHIISTEMPIEENRL